MSLFEYQIVENYEVKDDLLEVDADQIDVIYWFVIQALFYIKVEDQIVHSAAPHNHQHQYEEQIHLSVDSVANDLW